MKPATTIPETAERRSLTRRILGEIAWSHRDLIAAYRDGIPARQSPTSA